MRVAGVSLGRACLLLTIAEPAPPRSLHPSFLQMNELWKAHIPAQGPFAASDVARRFVAGGVAGVAACALVSHLLLLSCSCRGEAEGN